MNDILPGEVRRWQHLEETFRALVERYGYEALVASLGLEAQQVILRSKTLTALQEFFS